MSEAADPNPRFERISDYHGMGKQAIGRILVHELSTTARGGRNGEEGVAFPCHGWDVLGVASRMTRGHGLIVAEDVGQEASAMSLLAPFDSQFKHNMAAFSSQTPKAVEGTPFHVVSRAGTCGLVPPWDNEDRESHRRSVKHHVLAVKLLPHQLDTFLIPEHDAEVLAGKDRVPFGIYKDVTFWEFGPVGGWPGGPRHR